MVCHLLVLYTYVEKPIDHILQQSQYKVQYSDTSEIHKIIILCGLTPILTSSHNPPQTYIQHAPQRKDPSGTR